MDTATAQYHLKDNIEKLPVLDHDSLQYQQVMAKACGVALEKRILSFSLQPPPTDRHDLRASWNRPVKPKTAIAKRRIPLVPEKILDAPGIADDFYLNLMDWSSKNMLAVGLENTVYVWNGEAGTVHEFCKTKADDYVASLKWTADGSYLAVGTGQGDAQIWDLDSTSKIRSMRGHTSRVGVLSWDQHILSSGARDGSIWNHDVRIAQHKISELQGHTSEVCGLAWRPDGNLLASGGNDNLVHIWDARSSIPRITKSNHMAAVKVFFD
jgi:cell division cycle protein 20 (cofactor of APC complex)